MKEFLIPQLVPILAEPIRSVLHCGGLPDRGGGFILDWLLRFVLKWFSGDDCSYDLGGVSIAIV